MSWEEQLESHPNWEEGRARRAAEAVVADMENPSVQALIDLVSALEARIEYLEWALRRVLATLQEEGNR